MLQYVVVAALLVVACSGANPRYHKVKAVEAKPVRFSQSNGTLLSIAEELDIAEDLIDPQSISPLYGGAGGNAFTTRAAPIRTINIHSDIYISSIELVYKDGTSSGVFGRTTSPLRSFTLADGEYIISISGRSGGYVDGLTFKTTSGRTFGPLGGSGGNAFQVNGCILQGVFGRSGSLVDAIGFNCC